MPTFAAFFNPALCTTSVKCYIMNEKVYFLPVFQFEYVLDGSLETFNSDYVFGDMEKATKFASSQLDEFSQNPSNKNYKITCHFETIRLCS